VRAHMPENKKKVPAPSQKEHKFYTYIRTRNSNLDVLLIFFALSLEGINVCVERKTGIKE